MGLDPGSPGSGPGLKAGTKRLSHPSCPVLTSNTVDADTHPGSPGLSATGKLPGWFSVDTRVENVAPAPVSPGGWGRGPGGRTQNHTRPAGLGPWDQAEVPTCPGTLGSSWASLSNQLTSRAHPCCRLVHRRGESSRARRSRPRWEHGPGGDESSAGGRAPAPALCD